MLFYDYFHHEKFPNIPVSLVSEIHTKEDVEELKKDLIRLEP